MNNYKYKYEIDKDLKPYLRRVIHRCYNSCRMTQENGHLFCHTDVSPDRFERMLDRAKCEKKSDETGVFYMTFRESVDAAMAADLLHQANETAYGILDDPDGKKTLEYC